MKKEEWLLSANYLVMNNSRKRWRSYNYRANLREGHLQSGFLQVLEMKAGYARGLGHLVWQVGSSSFVSSVDLARRLEEARMEIEEMRDRQKEYDELVVRQAKMERVMRE
ncbi:hypothetical protein CJ030_MR6G020501 [Morella rubra]|uniref:Uncharacterized protein n=1 Tax=Morella rubra TaxID=262757 RepID=A0A6A1V9R2_9ROSI|nr:hypothetical protein CJ030_MR6G020501 [Morella rubra]